MILQGESKTIEYKLTYSKTLLKTVCAFANFHDGSIILGIRDDGQIEGVTQVEELKLSIEHAINDSVFPQPYYEFEGVKIKDKMLLELRVYKGDHTPYTYQGKVYIRQDTSTVQGDTYVMQQLILSGRNQSYEDLLAEEQNLTFVDLERRLRQQLQIGSLTEDLLRTLGLMQKGGYNHAATLLSDQNILLSSTLQLVAFSDEGVGRIKDHMTLKGMSILAQFDACMAFYQKHINTGEIISQAYRQTVEDVPMIAYREAIANLLVHRDYAIQASGRVEFYTNRIEIISPGSLPMGLVEEEYRSGRLSIARNKLLTDIFLRLKIIEKLATGVRRIKEQYVHQLDKPMFHVSEHAVVVVLPYVKEAMNKLRESSTPPMTRTLTGKAGLVYNYILQHPGAKRQRIQQEIGLEKTQTVQLIQQLRQQGYIIRQGNGPATGYQVLGKC